MGRTVVYAGFDLRSNLSFRWTGNRSEMANFSYTRTVVLNREEQIKFK